MSTHVCDRRLAFTLIELLVATTIFISLMGLLAVAFSRLSSGGQKALQVMEIHAKADALMRFTEKQLRTLPNVAAIHLQAAATDAPGTLTFMKFTNDTHPWRSHHGRTIDNKNPFTIGSQRYRFTDIIWTRWEWGDGKFKAGDSRLNNYKHRVHWEVNHKNIQRFNTATSDVIYKVDLDEAWGMQDNDVDPMVHRHYDFFEGRGGGAAAVDAATGNSAASAGQKIQVYESVEGNFRYTGHPWKHWYCDIFHDDDSPYRLISREYQGGDIRHHYTTLSVGSKNALTGENAYAVRNADGQSLNKDRLNLVGSDDVDDHGRLIYPNQILEIMDGIEFLHIDLIARDGDVIDSGDETDRLGDGAASLDISGVEPESGSGMRQRPARIRLHFLLHAIPTEELDDLDVDNDNDMDEQLADAIRDLINNDATLLNHVDRLRAYKKKALSFGYAAIEFNQSVQLGY